MTQWGNSNVVEDYLTALFRAEEWDEEPTTGKLAEVIGVTASTVSATLKKLNLEGFVNYRPYGDIELTPAGRDIAINVIRRRRIIETYLSEKLGLGAHELHGEADLLEHAVSPRVLEKMFQAVGYPTLDPHGDPIPTESGEMTINDGLMLLELKAGASATVTRVRDGNPSVVRYLTGVGITVGTTVTVVEALSDIATLRLQIGEMFQDIPLAVANAVRVSR
ncbi:metal-dependent transcriptional regulator [Corynebacterium glutamicum]|uniref:metal-dependent transcriptional regulator n=1 Tax=Corynebacterium glutamicum TaxID=1718 RepID=UPI0009607383|nr:metal-dependent transcriptional regulator [Corynebacterium glutamicum]OKX85503.1 transcriptional regulator [Corynebacterium glutamicum]QDX76390.1 transcriptional regulator [Corynebacterium glutamicum]QDX79168.1 transcriptional regulator [Corynebacterium glutamicum]QYR17056.1 metal-dependent transcriptional regulator [Corynebacterium glutamicum]TWS33131.1 transcriptional regulator [Corynebacterium glutamicum]